MAWGVVVKLPRFTVMVTPADHSHYQFGTILQKTHGVAFTPPTLTPRIRSEREIGLNRSIEILDNKDTFAYPLLNEAPDSVMLKARIGHADEVSRKITGGEQLLAVKATSSIDAENYARGISMLGNTASGKIRYSVNPQLFGKSEINVLSSVNAK